MKTLNLLWTFRHRVNMKILGRKSSSSAPSRHVDSKSLAAARSMALSILKDLKLSSARQQHDVWNGPNIARIFTYALPYYTVIKSNSTSVLHIPIEHADDVNKLCFELKHGLFTIYHKFPEIPVGM